MAVIYREFVKSKPKNKTASKRKPTNQRAARGKRMRTGKGWRLTSPHHLEFKVTLIKRLKVGDEDIAICRLLPTR